MVIRIITAIIILAVCGLAALYHWVAVTTAETARDASRAYSNIIVTAAEQSCLKKASFVKAVKSSGFFYNETDPTRSKEGLPTRYKHLDPKWPEGTTSAIFVLIKPQAGLVPPSFTRFYFDEKDCWKPQ